MPSLCGIINTIQLFGAKFRTRLVRFGSLSSASPQPIADENGLFDVGIHDTSTGSAQRLTLIKMMRALVLYFISADQKLQLITSVADHRVLVEVVLHRYGAADESGH